MAQPLDPIPQSDPLIDSTDRMNASWYRWLSNFVTRALGSSQRVGNAVHRTGLTSSVPTTSLFTPTQTQLYRVGWYAQVTTAAGINSSLAVTIGWTTNGVPQTKTFSPASLATNTTGSNDGDDVLIRADAGVAITYATTYASAGAPNMAYQIDAVVEQVT